MPVKHGADAEASAHETDRRSNQNSFATASTSTFTST
jgi:hypothetical protein